jgi:hypothetical protein
MRTPSLDETELMIGGKDVPFLQKRSYYYMNRSVGGKEKKRGPILACHMQEK